MNLFFDTSALIKKYIQEEGSDRVEVLMNEADCIFVSAITDIEVYSTFKRLLMENAIDASDLKILINEFSIDDQFYTHIGFDDAVSAQAKSVIGRYQLKTLDSIQLGTALVLKNEIDYFVVCDEKLIKSGKKEGLKIINPSI